MSRLEGRPQWWAAKWIPRGGEELGSSQRDKQLRGRNHVLSECLERHQSWRHRSRLGAQERWRPGSTAPGAIRTAAIHSHHITSLWGFFFSPSAPLVVSRRTRCPLVLSFSFPLAPRGNVSRHSHVWHTQGRSLKTSHGWGQNSVKDLLGPAY